jgi:hypothetical protein
MKRLLVVAVLVAAALLVGHVGDANAACTLLGKIVYVNTTTTGTFIYVAPSSITTIPYVFVFSTTNMLLANTALNAFAAGSRVNAVGNAASCPTTGVTRNAGTLMQLAAYRNQ